MRMMAMIVVSCLAVSTLAPAEDLPKSVDPATWKELQKLQIKKDDAKFRQIVERGEAVVPSVLAFLATGNTSTEIGIACDVWKGQKLHEIPSVREQIRAAAPRLINEYRPFEKVVGLLGDDPAIYPPLVEMVFRPCELEVYVRIAKIAQTIDPKLERLTQALVAGFTRQPNDQPRRTMGIRGIAALGPAGVPTFLILLDADGFDAYRSTILQNLYRKDVAERPDVIAAALKYLQHPAPRDRTLVNYEESHVRRNAAKLLYSRAGLQAVVTLLRQEPPPSNATLIATQDMLRGQFDYLDAALTATDLSAQPGFFRKEVAAALEAQQRDPKLLLPLLVDMLQGGSATRARFAAYALEKLQPIDPSLYPRVQAAADRTDDIVVRRTLAALILRPDVVKEPSSRTWLVAKLLSENEAERKMAYHAVLTQRGDAERTLIEEVVSNPGLTETQRSRLLEPLQNGIVGEALRSEDEKTWLVAWDDPAERAAFGELMLADREGRARAIAVVAEWVGRPGPQGKLAKLVIANSDSSDDFGLATFRKVGALSLVQLAASGNAASAVATPATTVIEKESKGFWIATAAALLLGLLTLMSVLVRACAQPAAAYSK